MRRLTQPWLAREASEVARVESPAWALSNQRRRLPQESWSSLASPPRHTTDVRFLLRRKSRSTCSDDDCADRCRRSLRLIPAAKKRRIRSRREKGEGRTLSADTGLFPQERKSSEEVVTTAHAHCSLTTDPDPTLLTRS